MAGEFTIVGIGEVLWDLLPGDTQLGGAPANSAYMAGLFGDRGVVASRVGRDPLGEELRGSLSQLRVDVSALQEDFGHPTGTVSVRLAPDGQPTFEIAERAAWDFLEFTPEWRALAAKADAVCFGTLAQRAPQSRRAIRSFLGALRPDALRVLDINLREPFYSPELVRESLPLADVLKLNEAEFRLVLEFAGCGAGDPVESARQLCRKFNLRLVSVTRGAQGSILVTSTESHVHSGIPIAVRDTVGAGDAFTAALTHHLLRGAPLNLIAEAANRAGAWVASQAGATPAGDAGAIRGILFPSR